METIKLVKLEVNSKKSNSLYNLFKINLILTHKLVNDQTYGIG